MTDLMQLGQQAKDSAQQLALMPTNRKNELLVQMAKPSKRINKRSSKQIRKT